MSNSSITIGLLAFISFSLITLISFVIAFIVKQKKESSQKDNSQLIAKKEITLNILNQVNFEDALNFKKVAKIASKESISIVNNSIGELSRQGLEVTKMITDKGKILAEFPKHIQKTIDSSKAAMVITKDGNAILVARDLKTGRFIAHANKVDPSIVNKLSKIGNVVVGAAHIISGHDIAKKLNIIGKNIDQILANRQNDMVAEIESIYEYMQELDIEQIQSDRPSLMYLKIRLKTIRNSWLKEVTCSLKNIDDPNSVGFLKKLFRRNKKAGEKLSTELNGLLTPLYVTRLALEMEKNLSLLLDEEEKFHSKTLLNQKNKIIELSELIKERKGWIDNLCNDDGNTSKESINASNSFIRSIEYNYKKKVA